MIMRKKSFWSYLLLPYYCVQLAVITCKLHFSKSHHCKKETDNYDDCDEDEDEDEDEKD